jgi:hypothetical protein
VAIAFSGYRPERDLNVDPMATHPARRKARFPRRGITRLRSCACAEKARGSIARYRGETERERERREFFARENAAYECLRADPDAWNAMLKESEAFDPVSVHPSDWL